MSRTHDVTISGFDLDRLEAKLEKSEAETARLRSILERSLPWLEAYDCGNTPCTCDGLEELIMDIKDACPPPTT